MRPIYDVLFCSLMETLLVQNVRPSEFESEAEQQSPPNRIHFRAANLNGKQNAATGRPPRALSLGQDGITICM